MLAAAFFVGLVFGALAGGFNVVRRARPSVCFPMMPRGRCLLKCARPHPALSQAWERVRAPDRSPADRATPLARQRPLRSRERTQPTGSRVSRTSSPGSARLLGAQGAPDQELLADNVQEAAVDALPVGHVARKARQGDIDGVDIFQVRRHRIQCDSLETRPGRTGRARRGRSDDSPSPNQSPEPPHGCPGSRSRPRMVPRRSGTTPARKPLIPCA